MPDLNFTQFNQFLAFLRDIGHAQQVKAGHVAFRRGETATAFFAVMTGRGRLIRYLQDGSELGLHIAKAGEMFAEAALFSKNIIRIIG